MGNDENPLHIVDMTEEIDEVTVPSNLESDATDALANTDLDGVLDDVYTLHPASTENHLSPPQLLPKTAAKQQKHSQRPFGSASEYLRIKREQNEAQRAQAQRLSIRQLSAFLGRKME